MLGLLISAISPGCFGCHPTGTHVAKICLFLLTESRHLPGRLLQSSPDRQRGGPGEIKIIDLDLSKYDRIASRFHQEQEAGVSFLKGGIETRTVSFRTKEGSGRANING
jgi:transcriptional regulatory protein RtcR